MRGSDDWEPKCNCPKQYIPPTSATQTHGITITFVQPVPSGSSSWDPCPVHHRPVYRPRKKEKSNG